jgi:hypothetical protein
MCPANAASPAASDALTDCLCAAGFAGGPGEACVECLADAFEAGDVCQACPANSVSAPRSAGASACQCKPGYSGPDGGACAACGRGQFKALAGAAACVFCNEHATTLDLAAADAGECRCAPGFAPSGQSSAGVTCAPCAADTYKNRTANAACAPCTPHSSAPAGSRNVSACACDAEYVAAGDGSCDRVCAAGFEAAGGPDGEALCAGCAPSTFKVERGDHACAACPAAAFSYARNQTSVYSCLCEAGHAWTRAEAGEAGEAGVACVACAAGTFNSLVNATTCYACDNGGAGSATTTACPGLLRAPAGFESVVGTQGIRACPPNHFQDGTSKACTECPQPSTYTAQAGLTGPAQCVCAEGYERTAGVCTACDTLSFKPGSGDGPCTQCTEHSQTLTTARTLALDCLCDPGHEMLAGGNSGQCGACAAGTTKLTRSNADPCVQCPPQSTLRVGARHLSEKCECNPGHFNSSVTQEESDCQPCQAGKYTPLYAAKVCVACPLHSTCAPAASSIAQCECVADYEPGPSGGPETERPCVATCGPGRRGSRGDCLACAKGTFKPAIGTACSTCPAARPASAAGAVSSQKCSCPRAQIGIRNTDMAVVQRLGAWMATDTLLLNASGQLAYDTSRSSPALWKLIARGAANLTVRVNGYLMFRCGASCSDVSVDLRGAKGSVRALSSRGVLELHGYTRREAVMRPGYMQLDAAALEQVSLWAAQGRLRPGDAVFRSRSVFDDTVCSACPRGLKCMEPS